MKANQHPIDYNNFSPSLNIFLNKVVFGLIMALALNSVLFAQAENAPPEARFITLPSVPVTHQPLTFAAAKSYDPDGTIIDFIWDFGDGHLGAGLQVEHMYQSPGVYPVTLIVVDSMGAEGTAMGEVQVVERSERDLPPNVMLEVDPVIPSAGTPVLFSAYPLPEQDAEPLQYFWDFGDRNFGEMPVEEHVYQDPGDYPVALTLTGDRGETVTDFLILSVAENTEKNGLLEGIVFHDLDANGRQDEGEPGLGDWEVAFMGPDTGVLITDAGGHFLQEVPMGTYQLSVDGKEGWTFTNMARPEVPVPAGRAGKVSVAVQQQDPTPPTPEEINPQDPPTLDPNIQCQCHCSAEIIGSDLMDWNQLSKVVYTVRSKMDCAAWLQSTGQRFGAGAVPWYDNVQWSVDQPAPTDPSQAVTLTGNGATVSVTIPAVGRQIGQQVTFTLRASFTSWGLCLDEESNTYNTVKFTCSASKKVTLTASCEDLIKDIARLQGEIMQLKRDIKGFEQQVTAKQNKLNAGLQTLDKELVERKKQLANLDQQLQSARQNLSKADTAFKSKGLDFVKIDTALKSCRSGLGSARFALTKLIRPIRSRIFNQWVLNQGSSVYTNVSSMQNDLTNTQELTEERLKALTLVVKDFLDTVYPEKRDLILVPDDLLNPSHSNEVYLLMTQHKLATLTRVAPSLVQLGSLIQQMVPLPSGRARGLQSVVEKTLGTTVSAETSKAVVEIVNFISNQILDVAKSSALQDADVSEADLDSKDEATRDKKIKFLRSFIAELSTKASTLAIDLAKAKRELDASRKTRDEAAAKVKKLEDQRSDLLKSIDDLEQRRTTLQQTLRNEINTLQQKISDLRTTLASKMAELDRLMKIYNDPTNNCKNLEIPAIASELSKPRVSLTGNQKPVMHMAVSGSPQTSYTLERSTNLHQWQPVTSITLDDLGDGEFTIDIAEDNNNVFFRSQSAR